MKTVVNIIVKNNCIAFFLIVCNGAQNIRLGCQLDGVDNAIENVTEKLSLLNKLIICTVRDGSLFMGMTGSDKK